MYSRSIVHRSWNPFWPLRIQDNDRLAPHDSALHRRDSLKIPFQGDAHVQQDADFQPTEAFAPSSLPSEGAGVPGVRHPCKSTSTATGRTGTAGNDGAAESAAGGYHHSSGFI